MKKAKEIIRVFLMVILFVCLTCSIGCKCSGGDKKELVLSSSSVEIDRYESAQLSVLDLSEDAVVEWSTSNEQVAVVSNSGLVEATGVGEAVITATVGKNTGKCEIKVFNSGAIPTLKLSKTEINVAEDASISIDAYVLYKGNEVDAEISYSIVDSTIAQYSEGMIRGLSHGNTLLCVETEYMGLALYETIDIKVNISAEIIVNEFELAGPYSIDLALSDVNGDITSKSLTASVYDCGNMISADNGFTWESLDSSVVKVTNGLVEPVSAGTSAVRVKCSVDGVEIYSDVNVNVFRPRVELSNKLAVDRLGTKKVNVDTSVFGTSNKITLLDGTVISSITNGQATFDSAWVSNTDDGIYDVLVIDSKVEYLTKVDLFSRYVNVSLSNFTISSAYDFENVSWVKNEGENAFSFISSATTIGLANGTSASAITPQIRFDQTNRGYLVFELTLDDASDVNTVCLIVGEHLYNLTVGYPEITILDESGFISSGITKDAKLTVIINLAEVTDMSSNRLGFSCGNGAINYKVENLRFYESEHLAIDFDLEKAYSQFKLDLSSFSVNSLDGAITWTQANTADLATTGMSGDVYKFTSTNSLDKIANAKGVCGQVSNMRATNGVLVFDFYASSEYYNNNFICLSIGMQAANLKYEYGGIKYKKQDGTIVNTVVADELIYVIIDLRQYSESRGEFASDEFMFTCGADDSQFYVGNFIYYDSEYFDIDKIGVKDEPEESGPSEEGQGPFTVIFDKDNGEATISLSVNKGETVQKPQDPIKNTKNAEYEFVGWYFRNTEWNFETAVTEDITLTAHWEIVSKYTEPILPKK